MIERADDMVSGTTLTADVCVVGAGAAGITIARDLDAAGASVVLLEGGGETFGARSAELYQGDNVGLTLRFGTAELSLDSVRLRYLGGSTNHWSGMCHPLDPHDLDHRAHLPWSGWPITADELGPWYLRAQETCEVGAAGWDGARWFADTYGVEPRGGADGVRPVVYRFSPPTRFGERYRPDLAASTTVRTVLDANVTALEHGAAGRITRARVRSLGGVALDVQADAFVVATGGIEVPRLLLASTGSSPTGIGNEHDLVGRTFMDHPHLVCGRMVLGGTPGELDPYRQTAWEQGGERIDTWAGWALTAEVQAEEGIGNAAVFGWDDGGALALGDRGGVREHLPAFHQWVTDDAPQRVYTVFVRTESEPDPESRVRLGDRLDALGMRRPVLDWRVGDFEWETARRTLELLGRALGETGTGRLEVDPSGRDLREVARLEMGNHHMGTARMSEDPADGVVDRHCRVHGEENLFVAGSAVFPTAGAANPTLTLVALAHRLADHLVSR